MISNEKLQISDDFSVSKFETQILLAFQLDYSPNQIWRIVIFIA